MKSFRKDIVLSIFTQLLYAVSQWLITIIIVKILGPSSLGVYGYLFAVSAPVFAFSNLGQRSLMATEKKITGLKTSLNFRLTTLLVVLFLILIYSLFDKNIVMAMMVPVLLFKIIEAVDDYFRGVLQQVKRFDIIMNSNLIFCLLSIPTTFLTISASKSLIPMLWCNFFIKMISLGYLILKIPNLKKLIQSDQPLQSFKSLWISGLPLGMAALLVAFNSNLPKYFIQNLLNSESLGLYLGMFFFITAGANLFVALKNAAAPNFAQIWHSDPEHFKRKIDKFQMITLILVFGAAIISFIVGGRILSIFYSPSFANSGKNLSILVLGGGFMFAQSFTSMGLTIARQLSAQPKIAFIAILSNAVVCSFLIPELGLTGACIGFSAGSFVILLFSRFHLLKTIKQRIREMPNS